MPPSEYQRRLRDARVLMLGVGGLGSWAAYALAVLRRRRARAAWTATSSRRATSTARSSTASATSAGRRSRPRAEALAEFDSSCRLDAGGAPARERRRGARGGRRRRLRRERRGLARPRHRALGERRLLRRRRAVHHDEPLAAGRARGPAVRARHAPAASRARSATYRDALPALRRARRAAPRAALARRRRSARCARSSAGRWRSRRSTSSPASCPPATLGVAYVYDLRTMERHAASPCRASPGCAGLRASTRPVPRGACASCIGPVHASGPKHGTWSRVREVRATRPIRPVVPSAHERMFGRRHR